MLSNARALGYMRLLSIWKADNVIEKLHFFILFYSNEGKCICQHRVGSYCIGLPTLTARWRIQSVQELGVLQHSVTRMKVAWLYPTLCDPMDCIVHGIPQARILEGVGSHSLLQGIFPTQGSNPGLPHCRRILYQLSHKGSLSTQHACTLWGIWGWEEDLSYCKQELVERMCVWFMQRLVGCFTILSCGIQYCAKRTINYNNEWGVRCQGNRETREKFIVQKRTEARRKIDFYM